MSLLDAAKVGSRLGSLGLEGSAISSIFSPARRPMFSTNGSRAIRSRRPSASTESWEITPAPTGPAQATCFPSLLGSEWQKGRWGHAIGGMGAITQAIAAPASPRRRDSHQLNGDRDSDREGPRRRRCHRQRRQDRRARAGFHLHPKLTFERLLDPAVLPADFRARIASIAAARGPSA